MNLCYHWLLEFKISNLKKEKWKSFWRFHQILDYPWKMSFRLIEIIYIIVWIVSTSKKSSSQSNIWISSIWEPNVQDNLVNLIIFNNSCCKENSVIWAQYKLSSLFEVLWIKYEKHEITDKYHNFEIFQQQIKIIKGHSREAHSEEK